MKLKFLVWFVSSLSVGIAHASNTYGIVTQVSSQEGGQFFVYLSQAKINGYVQPCAASGASAHRYVVDTTTTGGKTMAANLMLAYTLGKNVSIYGRGDYSGNFASNQMCTIWSDTENINWLSTW